MMIGFYRISFLMRTKFWSDILKLGPPCSLQRLEMNKVNYKGPILFEIGKIKFQHVQPSEHCVF